MPDPCNGELDAVMLGEVFLPTHRSPGQAEGDSLLTLQPGQMGMIWDFSMSNGG